MTVGSTRRAVAAGAILAGAVTLTSSVVEAESRALDFAARVDCQRRVEEVYRDLRGGVGAPLPEDVVARRAEDTLRLSSALAELWRRPLGPAELQAEIDRMARATKRPAVLRRLFVALDDDPREVAECLARPALVRRLARNRYASDPRFHADVRQAAEWGLAASTERIPLAGAARPEWAESAADEIARGFGVEASALEALPAGAESPLVERPDRFVRYRVERAEGGALEAVVSSWDKRPFDAWWDEARASFAAAAPPSASSDYRLPELGGAGCTPDTWQPTANDVPNPRDWPSAVWTGAEMIVFGGQAIPIAAAGAGRYDPATDTWSAPTTSGAPAARYLNTAVWTGSRMIVWGGVADGAITDSGGVYDPAADTWSATSTAAGVPSPRAVHTAVWTGSEMIVWGGQDSNGARSDGARYDPLADSWTPVAASPLAGRAAHTAVWTGAQMIVWGGESYPALFNDGARYVPSTNLWSRLPTLGAPAAARAEHTAVWTGSQMIVWGGRGNTASFLNSGGRYTPETNTWQGLTTASAPSGRYAHTAVWSGTRMIVFGGLVGIGVRGNTGGRYDPVADAWTATSTAAGVPQARMRHAAVWTGTEMIVWGGDDYGFGGLLYLQSGGRYDPVSNTWVATAAGATVPEARQYQSTAWTGAEMIVWGGYGSHLLETGGRYDPALDAWSPTTTTAAPAPRISASAVWTGDEMIVWGGSNPFTGLATGGRYDPGLDAWQPTTTAGAPVGRVFHAAVWTGREMVIVGRGPDVGRYRPATDSWAKSNAPAAVQADRSGPLALWAGDEMLVWGGLSSIDGAPPADGGRYDPRHDSWRFLRGPAAPPAASDGTAVWTGDELIVWGGADADGTPVGGARVDPGGGWSAVAEAGAPSPRRLAGAVWTGAEAIVWGGYSPAPSYPLASGARYDPGADTWTAVSSDGAPQAGFLQSVVFTDQPDPQLIVWGGTPVASSGGAYCAVCTPVAWFPDADGDGRGGAGPSVSACTRPVGHAPTSDDCDDADPDRFPGNPELCGDSKDNDCNGTIDDAAPAGTVEELYVTPLGVIGASFEWSYAAAADDYDLSRGSATLLVQSGGDFAAAADHCVASGVVARSASDPGDLPAPGDAFWYVVRGVNCAGAGSYDSGGPAQQGSRDASLGGAPGACP